MLVIINPVATKMSERVRSLVVYALQGRYDVTTRLTDAKGHAIELCREAAEQGYDVVCAFGGDGTVNEAANGLAGTSTALTCLPGGYNIRWQAPGHPDRPGRRHRAPPAPGRPLGAAAGRPRLVNGRYFTFAAGMGLDASVVERVDRNPRLKKRFGPSTSSSARSSRSCATTSSTRRGWRSRSTAGRRRRLPVRAERRELHLLQRPPGAAGRGRPLRLGNLRASS